MNISFSLNYDVKIKYFFNKTLSLAKKAMYNNGGYLIAQSIHYKKE